MLCWVLLPLLTAMSGGVRGGEVTYDGRSLIINGERKVLFSGSIHYPRSPREVLYILLLILFISFVIQICHA